LKRCLRVTRSRKEKGHIAVAEISSLEEQG